VRDRGFFSSNPDKAWAERFFLVYSPIWMIAVAVAMTSGVMHHWGDGQYLAFGLAVGLPPVLGPLLASGRPDRDLPFWRTYWFKLNAWVFILVAFGTFFGTAYFFDLMGMRYGFPVEWTFEADLVGRSRQTVPVFMYPLTQAYFLTYFVSMTVVLRKIDRCLELSWIGRALVILVLAYVVAWMETFAMAADVIGDWFSYADKDRMLRLGSFGYASYFIVGLPLVRRIDEGAERWSLSAVVMQALAACMLILCLLEAWAKIVGPIA
jgi:cycloeucalenol cycloisomerase